MNKELLTDRCKEDFEKWYSENPPKRNGSIESVLSGVINFQSDLELNLFYQLPLAAQFGVIVDFADSKGFIIDIQPVINYNKKQYTAVDHFIINVTKLGKDFQSELSEDLSTYTEKTRSEARIEAIKQFNKIYNDKLMP